MTFYILLFLLTPYLLQIFNLGRKLRGVSLDNLESDLAPKTKFSIIIPATIERFTLEQILENFQNQTYPKEFFEILIFFDGEKENYQFFKPKEIEYSNVQFQLIEETVGKKAVLEKLIESSKYDYLLQLDADVAIEKTILQAYDQIIRTHQPDCIVGGVKPQVEEIDDFFVKLFGLDFLSLQGIQIATLINNNPGMANGANLLYTKEAYHTVSKDLQNIKSESGDDTFLVQYLNKAGKNIVWGNLEASHIITPVPQSINEFLNQRARWGSKTNEYINLNYKILAYLTLLANLALLLGIFFWLGGKLLLSGLVFLYLLKGIVDFLLLRSVTNLYSQNFLLKNMIGNTIIYPFLLVIAAFKAIFGLYTWK